MGMTSSVDLINKEDEEGITDGCYENREFLQKYKYIVDSISSSVKNKTKITLRDTAYQDHSSDDPNAAITSLSHQSVLDEMPKHRLETYSTLSKLTKISKAKDAKTK